jgi:hypothetical protein
MNLLVKDGHDISVITGKSLASIWICQSDRVIVPDLVVRGRIV